VVSLHKGNPGKFFKDFENLTEAPFARCGPELELSCGISEYQVDDENAWGVAILIVSAGLEAGSNIVDVAEGKALGPVDEPDVLIADLDGFRGPVHLDGPIGAEPRIEAVPQRPFYS
jgi:hypothetical protein